MEISEELKQAFLKGLGKLEDSREDPKEMPKEMSKEMPKAFFRKFTPRASLDLQVHPHGTPTDGKRSKFEREVELQLIGMGCEPEFEADEIPYVSVYVPDFKLSNGIYIECKGFFDKDSRSKMLKVQHAHPMLDIRLLFMVDNKLEHSDTRYSQWCIRHGFRYAFKSVPLSWTNETPS